MSQGQAGGSRGRESPAQVLLSKQHVPDLWAQEDGFTEK